MAYENSYYQYFITQDCSLDPVVVGAADDYDEAKASISVAIDAIRETDKYSILTVEIEEVSRSVVFRQILEPGGENNVQIDEEGRRRKVSEAGFQPYGKGWD